MTGGRPVARPTTGSVTHVALPALVTGFLVSPAWYVWLGLSLRPGAASQMPS